MIRIHKLIATSLGIGYIGKGGGTVAAAVAALVWYLVLAGSNPAHFGPLLITVAITLLGIWSGTKVEPYWGKDDKKVVIDEVAGMMVSVLFVPVTPAYILAGLVLFRFFDIVKPLYVRRTEALPGGIGVMMDDIVAGIYSNLLLQLVIHLI
ncbi:phosphatidylglycerophosphatase A [Chitinophaga sp.]|uniref:phosphatidylglycerophosphatase A family protein n=1 Tax=Chitinophaga sp. TaxID=1869181 RepID=UPI0031DDE22B